MKVVAAGVAITLLMLASGVAGATDKAACAAAAQSAQRLRASHQLVEAREQLRLCAAPGCPAVVQTDCALWLGEVEQALPTVVIGARSRTGEDLVDVTVSVDGKPLGSAFDGTALPMNPGTHTFHFATAGGESLDQQVVIREGAKRQSVEVVLGPEPAATNAAPPSRPAHAPTPWTTVGWIAGGVGAAGLVVGTVFGVIAVSDKSAAHCDAAGVCDPGTTDGIKTAALVSDVALVAGAVLLASGVALVLFAPSGETKGEAKPTAKLGPLVTGGGAGAMLGGTF